MYDTAKTAFNFIKNNSSTLNGAAASWKNAGFGAKVGTTLAAGAFGLEAGRTVTGALANMGVGDKNSDFERIRQGQDPLAIAGERLKQLIVILVDGFLQLVKGLAYGAANIGNALDQLVNVFKLAGAAFGTAIGMFQSSIGDLITGLADTVSSLSGGLIDTSGLRQGGIDFKTTGDDLAKRSAEEGAKLAGRLSEGLALPQWMIDRIEGNYAELRNSVVGGLATSFFPPVQEAVREGFDELEQTAQEVATMDFSDDMVGAWGDFQDELKDIEADAQKEREKELAKHEKEKTALETDQQAARLQSIADFNRRQLEEQGNLNQDISDLHRDFERDEKEAARDFRRDERKARRDHLMTLLQAAAALDGRAIYLEQRRYKEESDQRRTAADDAKKERQRQLEQRITDMQAEFNREQEQARNNFYGIELPRLDAQHKEQMDKFNAQHQERLTQITTHAAEQSAAAEAAFIDTFNKLVEAEGTHQGLMLGEQRKGQAAMEAELAAWWTKQKTMVAGGKPTTSTTGTGTGAFYGSNNPYAPNTPVTPFPNLPSSPNDQGFFPDLAGAASLAMTAANSVSTQSAAALNTMNGGSRGGGAFSIGTLSTQIVLGDIGNRTDQEVKDLVDQAIVESLNKAAGKRRS
jgi:hypothetical protein